MPVDDAVRLVRAVAGAMAEAHERGIIHRDLKPANVMLDRREQPVIMDFGLALRPTANDDLRLTLSGVAIGTPAYMPPEQAGGDIDAVGTHSDVYSLGVILYELVTGRTPFQGRTFGKLLAQIERDPPPLPSGFNPKVDAALDAILLTALEKAPHQRFPHAGAFAEVLDAYVRGEKRPIAAQYGDAVRRSPAPLIVEGAPKRRSRVPAVAAVALGMLLVVLLGVVIYVQTGKGELVVELSDPNAAVDVKINGQEVVLDPNDKAIRIRAGLNQKLEVSGPDFETTSESFDLKRGGKRVVRVTLVPKKGNVAAAKPPEAPPPVPPVKPVSYPAAETRIDGAGWQILVDASGAKMEQWLADRKKAKHSVLWLDAYQVGGKPVFCAAATLDDRQPNWGAVLSMPSTEFNAGMEMPRLMNSRTNRFVSLGGYVKNNTPCLAVLWHPGRMGPWYVVPDGTLEQVKNASTENEKTGRVHRILRPFSIDRPNPVVAYYVEQALGEKNLFVPEVSAKELDRFVSTVRSQDYRVTSIAAFVHDGRQEFAAISRPNAEKWLWRTETNLSRAELTTNAANLGAQGFRPYSITACPWDGAVRYCVVWVKEPPKPTPAPKQATILSQLGWETIVDASQKEMETWLAECKKQKHSVIWLDAMQVAEQPVFAAVAALDDRHPNWNAFLDTPVDDFSNGKLLAQITPETDHPLAISGYLDKGKVVTTSLWRKGFIQFQSDPDGSLKGLSAYIAEFSDRGGVARVVRPHSVRETDIVTGVILHRSPGEKAEHLIDVAEGPMADFVKARQAAGERITSLAAYPKDGTMLYAVVGAANSEKRVWKAEHNLTVDQLKTKNTALAGEGYQPTNVTLCPWDGAVRYAVLWEKEPRKKE